MAGSIALPLASAPQHVLRAKNHRLESQTDISRPAQHYPSQRPSARERTIRHLPVGRSINLL